MFKEIRILESDKTVAVEAAKMFEEYANYFVENLGQFNVALAGGGTPKQMHQHLSKYNVDWTKIHILFSDERSVPPTAPNSNFFLAYNSLLKNIDIPNQNIHPMQTLGISAQESAFLYEKTVARLNKNLELDAIFLGIGPDGHTASIFPNSQLINSDYYIEAIHDSPKLPKTRISFTLKLLNNARNIVFLATGASKAKAVENILEKDLALPANLVRPPDGNLFWLLDKQAAKYL